MTRVAVTGGSGFIGSHVVDAFVEAGHEVTVVDQANLPHRGDVEFAQVDLLDQHALTRATRGAARRTRRVPGQG